MSYCIHVRGVCDPSIPHLLTILSECVNRGVYICTCRPLWTDGDTMPKEPLKLRAS